MTAQMLVGDCREVLCTLPDASVQCCVTSPPYFGLRDYGVSGQIGLEDTVDEFVQELVSVFREVKRVLRDDGTLWLNHGDSYAGSWGAQSRGQDTPGSLDGASMISARQMQVMPKGSKTGAIRDEGIKPKDLIGVPWMVAFALRADGWYLRSDIIWAKPNPMPESVRDRPTKAHEYLFLLTKSARYFYDADAIRTPLQPKTLTTYGIDRTTVGDQTGLVAGDNWARDVPQRKPRMKVPGGWDTGDGSHGTIHRNGRTEAEYKDIEGTAGANARTVWTIATHAFSEAHFATFPPALVEPCIKAGTSEKGRCPACGAPWRRRVETRYENPGNRSTNGPRSIAHKHTTTAGYDQRLEAIHETTGWEPGCSCNAGDPVPCMVLDPFGGAGTTSLVADRLGRDSIYIDLNPEYAEMARRRISQDAPLFAVVT